MSKLDTDVITDVFRMRKRSDSKFLDLLVKVKLNSPEAKKTIMDPSNSGDGIGLGNLQSVIPGRSDITGRKQYVD